MAMPKLSMKECDPSCPTDDLDFSTLTQTQAFDIATAIAANDAALQLILNELGEMTATYDCVAETLTIDPPGAQAPIVIQMGMMCAPLAP